MDLPSAGRFSFDSHFSAENLWPARCRGRRESCAAERPDTGPPGVPAPRAGRRQNPSRQTARANRISEFQIETPHLPIEVRTSRSKLPTYPPQVWPLAIESADFAIETPTCPPKSGPRDRKCGLRDRNDAAPIESADFAVERGCAPMELGSCDRDRHLRSPSRDFSFAGLISERDIPSCQSRERTPRREHHTSGPDLARIGRDRRLGVRNSVLPLSRWHLLIATKDFATQIAKSPRPSRPCRSQRRARR